MTWTKLSDDYSDDCWTLSDAAFRLHTEALVWSNRKLLDCVIPADDLRRFAKNPEAAPELVDVGWWVLTDDGFYVIRHHATYQRTREAVLNQQSANATNGAKGGRPRKPGRERHGTPRPSETESLSESETERDGTGRDWTGLDVEASTSARDDDDSEPDSWSSSFAPDDDAPDLEALARDGWATPSAPEHAAPPVAAPPSALAGAIAALTQHDQRRARWDTEDDAPSTGTDRNVTPPVTRNTGTGRDGTGRAHDDEDSQIADISGSLDLDALSSDDLAALEADGYAPAPSSDPWGAACSSCGWVLRDGACPNVRCRGRLDDDPVPVVVPPARPGGTGWHISPEDYR